MKDVKFAYNGEHYALATPGQGRIYDRLPPAVYDIHLTPDGIKIVHVCDRFGMPEKLIYDEKTRYFKPISSTYYNRAEKGLNTGVMLTGMKGTGKSLMAKRFGNQMIDDGKPVIRVSNALSAEVLETVLMHTGPCMVLFDEFAKTYSNSTRTVNSDYQNSLLGLFSSSELSGVLFVLTENDKDNISPLLIDRPGRMLFSLEFYPLSTEMAYQYMVEYGFDTRTARYIARAILNATHDMIACLYELYEPYKFMLDEGMGEEEFISLLDAVSVPLIAPRVVSGGRMTLTPINGFDNPMPLVSAVYNEVAGDGVDSGSSYIDLFDSDGRKVMTYSKGATAISDLNKLGWTVYSVDFTHKPMETFDEIAVGVPIKVRVASLKEEGDSDGASKGSVGEMGVTQATRELLKVQPGWSAFEHPVSSHARAMTNFVGSKAMSKPSVTTGLKDVSGKVYD